MTSLLPKKSSFGPARWSIYGKRMMEAIPEIEANPKMNQIVSFSRKFIDESLKTQSGIRRKTQSVIIVNVACVYVIPRALESEAHALLSLLIRNSSPFE
jgi:hypothetical protein